jgi:hypothetical protein
MTAHHHRIQGVGLDLGESLFDQPSDLPDRGETLCLAAYLL